jgi:2-dehydropantoate 2-reductase
MATHPVIGIAGAGAVGLHYGLALQRAGWDVRFLARGEHLAAMQQAGVHYHSMGEVSCMMVQVSDDPAMLAACDVVILACKTTQLDAMLASLLPYVTDAVWLTMQNGVTAPDVVRQYVPDASVIAASAFIGARIESPGVVVHSAAGHLRLGAWHGEVSVLLASLCTAWQQGCVDAQAVTDMRAMLWQKMLWNCGFNAMTALTQSYARDVASDQGLQSWVITAMEEARTVAQCVGVMLDANVIAQHLALTLDAGAVKSSMWQDVAYHRAVEIEAMNGHIVHVAKQFDVAVPVNRILYDLMRGLTRNPSS